MVEIQRIGRGFDFEAARGTFPGACDECGRAAPICNGFGNGSYLCARCCRPGYPAGWYWWAPDLDARGPYRSESAATVAALRDAPFGWPAGFEVTDEV